MTKKAEQPIKEDQAFWDRVLERAKRYAPKDKNNKMFKEMGINLNENPKEEKKD